MGYLVMVEPKSIVYHVGGGTLNVESPFKTYLNFRNNHYMLFKNLPLISLFTVIPIRLILDGVAAFTFLKQRKGLLHFLMIGKAHIHFYSKIPELILKRKHITQKRKLIGKTNYSILIKNKIKRIKAFDKL